MATNISIPLQSPRDPGYFRLQRYSTSSKLPAEVRELVQPLSPGEAYYLALGGIYGFSGGAVRYQHRMSTPPIELPIGEAREDGLQIATSFLGSVWAPSLANGSAAARILSFVRVVCGLYEDRDAPNGPRWRTIVDRTIPETNGALSIPEGEIATCTHLRVTHAEAYPVLVTKSNSTPTWQPVFVAPLCMVEIE